MTFTRTSESNRRSYEATEAVATESQAENSGASTGFKPMTSA